MVRQYILILVFFIAAPLSYATDVYEINFLNKSGYGKIDHGKCTDIISSSPETLVVSSSFILGKCGNGDVFIRVNDKKGQRMIDIQPPRIGPPEMTLYHDDKYLGSTHSTYSDAYFDVNYNHSFGSIVVKQ